MLKVKHLNSLIIFFFFALLPVDMVNGILLRNQVLLPISIGQFFKIFILLLLFFRFLFNVKYLILSFAGFFILLIPSLFQLIHNNGESNFLYDLVKISRYLLPILSFLFFIPIIIQKDQKNISRLFTLVKFSYYFLIINIFLKPIGLGYPMYEEGDIGSKGFFYAGNEISALLIVLASIIAVNLWIRQERVKYFLFFALNITVGLILSSKTGILGIGLVFLLIPLRRLSSRLNYKRLKLFLFTTLILLPTLMIVSWQFIANSAIINRFTFFWERLDIWTFILSSRNEYFKRAWSIYLDKYTLPEKIIGVGQSKFETLNQGEIVEMDLADIFFAYGFIGVSIFILLMLLLWIQLKLLAKHAEYFYRNFVFLMFILLLAISTVAGHVFSSGMAAVFIGLLFSLMFLKRHASFTK